MHTHGVCNIPESVSSKKAAKLLGCAPSTTSRQCESGKFEGATKALVDGVEAWQIPIASLPIHAQKKMKDEVMATMTARLASAVPRNALAPSWRAW